MDAIWSITSYEHKSGHICGRKLRTISAAVIFSSTNEK